MTVLPPAVSRKCIFHMTKDVVVGVLMCCMWAGLYSRAIAAADEPNGAGSFEMQMVYKYSQEFRELTNGKPGWEHLAAEEWPALGTPEFYHMLVMQDRHRHASRKLLANDTDAYYFTPSNATLNFPTLGGIHYTAIALGTPMKQFLVALDTGSDLLWVPCDCQQCSVANWTSYGLDSLETLNFSIYSPSNSTSSKTVACISEICTSTLLPTCDAGATNPCNYVVKYLSANTSSSGTIVQDVVYLDPTSGVGESVKADIYFGCGTRQTGDFLKGGAPNGLLGLGPEVYSVPRTLARTGVIQDVFSMCFSTPSDFGRLVFGKKPAASLQSTPLIATKPSVFYVLGLEGVVVGDASLNVSGNVVFDTGTSITSLPSNIINRLGDIMASKTTLKTWSLNHSESLQFSHCWNATTEAELESLSSLTFIFGGGGHWTIANPFLLFGENNVLDFVCLGILASASVNEPSILGFNFMAMYEYYFDLQTSTFSWSPSDCSNATSAASTTPPISAPSASPSSRSPSTSPSKTQEPPPKSSLDDLPPTNAPPSSEAYTSSLHNIPFQISFLLVSTMLFYLIPK